MFRTCSIFLLACAVGAATAQTVSYNSPTFDRWNYPFNGSPGVKDVAATFSSGFVPDLFDDRDAQFLNTFVTAGDVTAGLGAANYHITSARFTVSLDPRFANLVAYDNTYDAWQTALDPSQTGYTPDTDAGRPMELYATGFRNGLNPFSYNDSMAFSFGDPTLEDVRNAFAADVDPLGNLRDVSNNIRDGFDANPLAIGHIEGLNPGDLVGEGATFVFDLNVADAGIQQYLAASLDLGAVSLSLTSLNPATQGGDVTYPGFYTNDSFFPDAQAATFEFTYEIIPAPGTLSLLAGTMVFGFRRRR